MNDEKKKELIAKIVIIVVYGLVCVSFVATLILMFTVFPMWLFDLIGW